MSGKVLNSSKISNTLFCLIIVLLGNFVCAQTTVFGTVTNIENKIIANANIILKNKTTLAIESFTKTDKFGRFKFSALKVGNFELVFSAMGYTTQKIPVICSVTSSLEQNVILTANDLVIDEVVIDEVVIKNNLPITVKQDTIIIDAKAFAKGNEAVVEDLLKKIPGLTVTDNGTIKVDGKEVSKIMVGGDDFFEHGYKLLTKNMSANVVDKVEVYQKYSSNRLLKGIENSDKVALNLTLKKNIKTQWFGNASLGYGLFSENKYETRINLMSFQKKVKHYLVTNLNNVGLDAVGDVSSIINPVNTESKDAVGDGENALKLINLNGLSPNLKAERTNFNNAEVTSLNSIYTLTSKIKLKTILFYNSDATDFFKNTFQSYKTDSFTSLDYFEKYNLKDKQNIGYGKVNLYYEISKTKTLDFFTTYNWINSNVNSNLNLNEQLSRETLVTKTTRLDSKLEYTAKLRSNKVFVFTLRNSNENAPQEYKTNVYRFSNLFLNNNNVSQFSQISQSKMEYTCLDLKFLNKSENKNLFEFSSGYEIRNDFLYSHIALDAMPVATNVYKNELNFTKSVFYFKPSYLYVLNKKEITFNLDVFALNNKLNSNLTSSSQNSIYLAPKLTFAWRFNDTNKMKISYGYNTTSPVVANVYEGVVMVNNRSFAKNSGNLSLLKTSVFLGNYSIGNWQNKFFGNLFTSYVVNHDFYTTNTIFSPNYILSENVLIKNKRVYNLGGTADYFFKSMQSVIKGTFVVSKINYNTILENSTSRNFTVFNYNYGLELRTSFKGIMNFHLGSKWNVNKLNASVFLSKTMDNVSFVDVIFVCNKKLNFSLMTEQCYFRNLDKTNNKYYFSDLEAKYILKDNGLTFSLTGKNLFNTNVFKENVITDLSYSSTEYKLLPRYILLKLDFRF